jgi:sarcosine oxidase subunit beta
VTDTADVVVVGAGIVGASIAYHLATVGARVVVYDGGQIAGSGASATSAGQIRMYHPDPADAELAVRSLPMFLQWTDMVGGDCGFQQSGFAFLAAGRPEIAATVARLAESGVDIQLLAPERFGAGHPALCLDGVTQVVYEPASGYADPVRTVRTLLHAAERQGAKVRPEEPVLDLIPGTNAVTGVRTTRSRTHAPAVVLATGIRAGELLPPGLLPLTGRPVGWCVAAAAAVGVDHLPMIIDDPLGTYLRPYGSDRLLFRAVLDGGRGAIAPADAIDERIVAYSRRLVAGRVPALATAEVLTTRYAVEAYTPDSRPMIGPAPELPGLYVAVGFSGGGFKAAPAVGAAVAAEVLHGGAREELVRYRPARFTQQPTGSA